MEVKKKNKIFIYGNGRLSNLDYVFYTVYLEKLIVE